jgi:sarcosine/dimethylglycine N-methyltransferase
VSASDTVDAQYATGLSRAGIERALAAAGKDLARLAPADLGALEDFHTLGRIATGQLAELARVTRADRVLDAGAGIGGTARFLAATYGCQVTAVDLTGEYVETAGWLNQLTGLDGKITVRQADVTRLPFAGAAFDLVASQHVQMNVADKAGLYAEARRVLVTGGPPRRLGYHRRRGGRTRLPAAVGGRAGPQPPRPARAAARRDRGRRVHRQPLG